MKHKIDLHGLSHSDALKEVEEFLLFSSLDKAMVCEIITGNSTILQQKIIKEILAPHKFYYYIPPSNLGTIIVSDTTL